MGGIYRERMMEHRDRLMEQGKMIPFDVMTLSMALRALIKNKQTASAYSTVCDVCDVCVRARREIVNAIGLRCAIGLTTVVDSSKW